MSPNDIYFEQIDASFWHVHSRALPGGGPIGWVRQRVVFEAALGGSPRAQKLLTSLDASREWFAMQLRSLR